MRFFTAASTNRQSRPGCSFGGIIGVFAVVFMFTYLIYTSAFPSDAPEVSVSPTLPPAEPQAEFSFGDSTSPQEQLPQAASPASAKLISSENMSDDRSADLVLDTSGNVYRGQIFYCDGEKGSLTYALHGKFSQMLGTIYVPMVSKEVGQDEVELPPRVEVFGDGLPLYSLVGLLDGDLPRYFDIDVSGFEEVTITMEGSIGPSYDSYPLNCLADLRFE